MIVVGLVPLAEEAFLDLADVRSLSALGPRQINMQTKTLRPPVEDGAESKADGFEVEELVSVFLSPDDEHDHDQTVNVESDRRARYDAVIQYGDQVILVVESKLFPGAPRDQAININTGTWNG